MVHNESGDEAWTLEELTEEQLALLREVGDDADRQRPRADTYEQIERLACAAIREQRLASNLSQAELARRMTAVGFPMQQTTVAKLEAGSRPLRFAELHALASCLDVPWLALVLGRSAPASEEFPMAYFQELLESHERGQLEIEEEMIRSLRTFAKLYSIHSASATIYADQIRRAAAAANREAKRDMRP